MPELNNQNFNHLKIHTQYSICEGAIKIDNLKDFCKEKKIPCLGLSDTSNLCGALEFAENISKVGTQPIIGTQIYFRFEDTTGLLPLIALNENGYKRIIELSSRSYLENDALSDPHLDVKDLLIDIGEYKLRAAVQSIMPGSRLKTNIATVSRDGLGFDDTGLVKIISEFQSRPIAQYSPNRESICVKRHRYKLHLNKQPAGKFKTLPHGYRKVKRVLFDTKTDCQRVEDRLDLTTKSGFNESIVDIMSRDTTVTMEDLFLLTNCDRIIGL